MRILFLTSSEEDYLSDSLLLGFKQIFGNDVVDYPRRDILYRDCPEFIHRQVRGNGFTLYTGLLDGVAVDRHGVGSKLKEARYDLVVISDIWRQFGFFTQWRPYLTPENTVLIDGTDTSQVFPHAGYWWRRPSWWFLPRSAVGFLYFKREMDGRSRFNFWHRLLPAFLLSSLPHYPGLRRISFGFPESKVVTFLPVKTKDFPCHLVDAEVATAIPGSSVSYAFKTEADYYADLQSSRFGVTTRRAGWDCLRHYEIAANGAVPCFRDLHKKPVDCAPHGLIPGKNCLSYNTAADLLQQVKDLSAERYLEVQQGALAWVRTKSTRALAAAVVSEWRNLRAYGPAALPTNKTLVRLRD